MRQEPNHSMPKHKPVAHWRRVLPEPDTLKLLPPEFRNPPLGARQEIVKFLPFDMAIEHPFICSQGKILVHMRRTVVEEDAVYSETASDVNPGVGLFRRGGVVAITRE